MTFFTMQIWLTCCRPPATRSSDRLVHFAKPLTGLRTLPRNIPVVWCGGLENSTEVLERLSEQRPVLGSSIAAIRSVRDPAGYCLYYRPQICEFPAAIFRQRILPAAFCSTIQIGPLPRIDGS